MTMINLNSESDIVENYSYGNRIVIYESDYAEAIRNSGGSYGEATALDKSRPVIIISNSYNKNYVLAVAQSTSHSYTNKSMSFLVPFGFSNENSTVYIRKFVFQLDKDIILHSNNNRQGLERTCKRKLLDLIFDELDYKEEEKIKSYEEEQINY